MSINQVLRPESLHSTQRKIRVFTREISTVYLCIYDLSAFWHHLIYGKPYKLRALFKSPIIGLGSYEWFASLHPSDSHSLAVRIISLRGKGCVPLFWNNPYGVYCAWFLPSILQQQKAEWLTLYRVISTYYDIPIRNCTSSFSVACGLRIVHYYISYPLWPIVSYLCSRMFELKA